MPLHTNFIASRTTVRLRSRRLARLGLRWTPWLGLVLLTIPLLLLTAASMLADALLKTREVRDQIADRAAETPRMKDDLRSLKSLRRTVTGMHANNAQWLALTGELRDRLPAGVWLTRVTVAEAGVQDGRPSQQLLLEGKCESLDGAGALVKALSESPWCAAAVLQSSGAAAPLDTKAAVTSPAPLRFTIAASLRRPIETVVGEPRS